DRRNDRAEPGQRQHLADGEQNPRGDQVRREQAKREGRRGDDEAYRRDERVGGGPRRTGAVANHAAQPSPEDAADENDRAVKPADLVEWQLEAAGEEARQPEDKAVAEDRSRGSAERQQPEAGRSGECGGDRRERRRFDQSGGIELASHRFGDAELDQQPRRQAEQADDDEGRAPAEMRGEPADRNRDYGVENSERDPECAERFVVKTEL